MVKGIYIAALLLVELPVGIPKDVRVLVHLSCLIVSELLLARYVLEEVAHLRDRTLRFTFVLGVNLLLLFPNLETFSARYELITLLFPLFPVGRPQVIFEEGDIQVSNDTHPLQIMNDNKQSQLLSTNQIRVKVTALQQLLVCSLSRNHTIVNHEDDVTVHDRA